MIAKAETTEQFAQRRMREKLIEELSKECPVCNAMVHRTANGEDGLPEGIVFEAAYHCGGRIFVADDADFQVQQGCERSISSACMELWEELDSDREGLIAEIKDLEGNDSPHEADDVREAAR